MNVDFTDPFLKQRKAAPKKIKVALREALELFLDDPDHPSLRNHALKDAYAGHRSIDVTSDWRAIFVVKGKKKIIFKFLGTHKKLYG